MTERPTERMTPTIRKVLFVEDDRRFRDAISILLGGHSLEGHVAGSATEALALYDSVRPDVCLVDLGLPDRHGCVLIEELLRKRADLPIVVLTIATSKDEILRAFRAGAVGYLLKEDLSRRLAPAIEDALAGGAPMSPSVARLVLSEIRNAPPLVAERELVPVLTARERSVIETLSRGLSYSDTALCLDISVNTVRAHVRSIYEKLSVTSKTEAVVEALRLGVIRN